MVGRAKKKGGRQAVAISIFRKQTHAPYYESCRRIHRRAGTETRPYTS